MRTWPLDKVPLGALPKAFVAHQGTWKVIEDNSGAKPRRLVEQSAKNADPVFNVLLVQGLALADVHLRVRVRAVSGKLDQGGGLVWRARDTHNYYITRYNPLENNLRLYTVRNGRRKQLASARLKLPQGKWFPLGVIMKGDHIRVFIGGKVLLEKRDKTFPAAGAIGLWTKADARTRFSDLRATLPR